MIETDTALDCWKAMLAHVRRHGTDFIDENGRTCREALNIPATILSPERDITRPISILTSFKHWHYPSLQEIAHIMLSNTAPPEYNYSYGARLFNFNGINQINDYIIPLLKNHPTSRRAVVMLWDPTKDARLTTRDNPGLVSVDFKLRNGKLHLTAQVRSNDMFFGWPANIYQLHVLQKHISELLGCANGSITTFSTSAHIFLDQLAYIKKILTER